MRKLRSTTEQQSRRISAFGRSGLYQALDKDRLVRPREVRVAQQVDVVRKGKTEVGRGVKLNIGVWRESR